MFVKEIKDLVFDLTYTFILISSFLLLSGTEYVLANKEINNCIFYHVLKGVLLC